MVAALMVSTLTAVLPQQPVSAAGSMADGMSLDDQVKSFVYYRALGACVGYDGSNLKDGVAFSNGDWINQADAKSGSWFADPGFLSGGTSVAGAYLDGINGASLNSSQVVSCSKLVNGALTLWGKWAPDEALCAMGFRRVDDGEFNAGRCTDAQGGSDQFERGAKLTGGQATVYYQAVQARVYGGTEPKLSDAAKYLLYLKTFQKVCVPNATVSTSAPTGTTTRDYIVRQASRVGTTVPITPTYYTGLSNLQQTDKVSISPSLTPNDLMKEGVDSNTCAGLVKAINGDSGKNNGLVDAYQAYLIQNSTANDGSKGALTCATGSATDASGKPCPTTGSTTSCAIDGIGWIVCPVIIFLAGIADNAYAFLTTNFLVTNPSLINTDPNATNPDGSKVGTVTFDAWGTVRTFANVAFIIAFLIIIFSQLTSVGIGNFGIKKLLPRLLIAAVLVNLSFFVCQIAVDLSNILGYSVKDLFAGMAGQVKLPDNIDTSSPGDVAQATSVLGLSGITATVLASAAGIYLMLPFLGGAILAGVVALLLIGFILIARKALIVLLIVIAPLAFVAFLLPNTEQYFKSWRKAFTALLLVFPIVGVVFGGSQLAASVLRSAAGSDNLLQVVAAATAVIPLFVVPALLKGSLNAVGNIGSTINSIGGKLQGSAKSRGQKLYDNSRLGQFKKFREGAWNRRRAAMQGGTYRARGGRANPLNWLTAGNKGLNRISGQFGNNLAAGGAAIIDEEAERDVKNAAALMTRQQLTSKEIQDLAHGREVVRDGQVIMRRPDDAMRKAAIREHMRVGTTAEAEQLLAGSSTASREVRQEMARGIHANGHVAKADYLGGDFADKIINGFIKSDADIDNAAAQRLNAGKLSAEAMVGQDADALKRLAKVAGDSAAGLRNGGGVVAVTSTAIGDISAQAAKAMTDPILASKITSQKATPIDTIRQIDSSWELPEEGEGWWNEIDGTGVGPEEDKQ